MCLTDNSFNNLQTGNVVDMILHGMTHKGLVGTTDQNGIFETSLYHGDYDIIITHKDARAPSARSFHVLSNESMQETMTVQIQVSS